MNPKSEGPQLFIVRPQHVGQRLDKVLATHPEIRTRSRAQKLIEMDLVSLNQKPAKSSWVVEAKDTIHFSLPPPESSTLIPLSREIEICYEDKDVMVVDKPAGLVVHPAAGHKNDTLVNVLLSLGRPLSMGFNENRPGIVHRLDRDTSGLIVIAKNDRAHTHLAEQFRKKTTHRVYYAIVHGRPAKDSGTVISSLSRHPKDRKRFASSTTGIGKKAVTHYEAVATHAHDVTLMRLKLETGRTHQIRVHLSEMGCPILGDRVYASNRRRHTKSASLDQQIEQLSRFVLHAAELGFISPSSRKAVRVISDWPEDLQGIVGSLGWKTLL